MLCIICKALLQSRSTDGGKTWAPAVDLPESGVDPDMCLIDQRPPSTECKSFWAATQRWLPVVNVPPALAGGTVFRQRDLDLNGKLAIIKIPFICYPFMSPVRHDVYENVHLGYAVADLLVQRE